MPKRIQRRRTKGWRMPANAVSVTRPGVFGNPFRTSDDKAKAVESFRRWVRGELHPLFEIDRQRLLDRLPELKGKDLACWCGDGPCHADVLLELANGPEFASHDGGTASP